MKSIIFLLALVASVTAKCQCYNTPYLASAGNWVIPLDAYYLEPCFVTSQIAKGAMAANSIRYDTPNQLKAAKVTGVNSSLVAVWHSIDCNTVYLTEFDNDGNDSAYFSCSFLPECMLTIISFSVDTVFAQPFAPSSAIIGIPYMCDPLHAEEPIMESSYLYWLFDGTSYILKQAEQKPVNSVVKKTSIKGDN